MERANPRQRSAFIKTPARPLQAPCWLAVAQRPSEPLCIDGIASLQRDFNDGDRARQLLLETVGNQFLDSQREGAEYVLDIFTDRLTFDKRFNHRNCTVTEGVFDVGEVPAFGPHPSEALVYVEYEWA